MANTKSAWKAIRVSERKRRRNQPIKSTSKTYLTKARRAIASEEPNTGLAVMQAVQALDEAARKGVLHPNNAARRKSRLMKRYNALPAQSAESG